MPALSAARSLTDEERAALRDRLRHVVSLVGTQAEAAELAGVSLRQMKKYLAGAALPPPYRVIASLAKAADVDPEWLMSGRGDETRRAIRGEADVIADAVPVDEAAGESIRRRTALTRKVTRALTIAYADLGASASDADLQSAALTIATLVLDVPRMRADQVDSAAAEFAVVAHRQAHRLAKTAAPPTTSGGKKRA